MKSLIVALVFICSSAHADYFVGVGQGIRTQEDPAGAKVGILTPSTFAFGWISEDWSALAEATFVRHESGAGNTLVSNKQTDAIVWLRKHFGASYWHPFVALGGGFQQSLVETHLAGVVTSNLGQRTNVLGIGLGVQSQIVDALNFGFDLRYLNGSQLRTVTSFESVSKLIYQF